MFSVAILAQGTFSTGSRLAQLLKMSTRKKLQFAYHLLIESEDALVEKLNAEREGGADREVIRLIEQQIDNCHYQMEKLHKKLDVMGAGIEWIRLRFVVCLSLLNACPKTK